MLVVTAGVQVVVFLLRPTITYQALALGASVSQLGLIVATFSTFSLFLSIPVGRGVDRRGERGYLLAGALLLLVSVAALGLAQQLWMVGVGSAALGLSQMMAMVACQTIIANGRDAPRRDQRFATFTLVTSTAQFTAPGVAGLLIATTPASQPAADSLAHVYLLAGAAAAVSAAVSVTLRLRPGSLTARPQHFGPAAPGVLSEVLRTRSVMVALTVGFSVLSANDLMVAFMPAFGQMRGYSPSVVGALIATFGLASVLVRIFLLSLVRRHSRTQLLTVSLVMATAGFGAVPVVTWIPGLFGLMLVGGAGLGLCQPVAMGWVAEAVRPEVRGTATSVRMTGNRLGQTVVPLGVATLAGAAGVAVAFVAPAVLLLATAGLVFWARADTDRA